MCDLHERYISDQPWPTAIFIDYEILKLVFNRPQLFLIFCQSLYDIIGRVLLRTFISNRSFSLENRSSDSVTTVFTESDIGARKDIKANRADITGREYE